MRFGTMVAAVVAVVGALSLAGTSGAQTTPTMTVAPQQVDPGETVSITVTGCTGEPEVTVHEEYSDALAFLPFEPASGGSWVAEVEVTGPPGATFFDLGLHGRCDGVDLGRVVVDVEHPTMRFGPILAPNGPPDPPTEVFGTDCPEGTTSLDVTVSSPGDQWVSTVEVDEDGDWAVELPDDLDPDVPFHVTASCGDVTYPELVYEPRPGSTTTTAPSSTSTVPKERGTDAEPAIPVSGRPVFTG